MPTSIEQLERWMQAPREVEGLEFKAARQTYHGDDLLDYCVAIANEGGGQLILGVTDNPPRTVCGTRAVGDVQGMQNKVYDVLRFDVRIEELQHPDGRVVICHVPSRLRGMPLHHDGKYLMRSGEALRPMLPEKLREIFAEGNPDWLEGYSREGLNAADIVDLLDTQAFFELLNFPYPPEQRAVIARLCDERLIDEHDGFHIRRLGALLLAKNLKSFPDVARKAPRVVIYKGDTKAETRLDVEGTKGYASGFQGLVRFVMSHLPQNEVIEDALRKEMKLVPEIAIRELIANALIHQDFAETGTSMMVEVYDNRVEISNPGEPIVPVDRFIDGYRSRNERLAELMRRFGICEEKSSGIDKVVIAAEAYQLPAPDFRAGFHRTQTIIFGVKPFEAMDRDDRIRACYQHCALRYVLGEQMTNQSLRERFNLPENKSAIISQIIAATQDATLIKADEQSGGSRKFARYIPIWA